MPTVGDTQENQAGQVDSFSGTRGRGHRLPLPGGREHPNLPLETAAQSILLSLQVVARLKVQPEALGGAEVPR